MKILLTAVNAKYIHSNLAVYSLKACVGEGKEDVMIGEYTINHRKEEILADLYRKEPDVLAFSCYIWNREYITSLIRIFHLLRPQVPIWVGGPEISYDGAAFLEEFPEVTGILVGEGERSFAALVNAYRRADGTAVELGKIPGLIYRSGEEIFENPPAVLMDLDAIPFVYRDLKAFANKIIYYESSRGCPFSCSYCLSSIDKKVRFRSLDLVFAELQFFLDAKVSQVKFVDRTFNCSHSHAKSIWRYLYEHDNGVTNFHFEVSADLLDEEELSLLNKMRPGLVQLEIGVQSVNEKTIAEIRRTMALPLLERAVTRVHSGKNIHQHLDLIAGLPYEDYESFIHSFDRVYRMKPQQLQLGFLKVLKGSLMHEKAKEYGIRYQPEPPYEVLETNWISYGEILELKEVEEMVEVYYNSRQFVHTMKELEKAFAHPFALYQNLAQFYREEGLNGRSHSRMERFSILRTFIEKWDGSRQVLLDELLLYDLYLRENSKSRPVWGKDTKEYKEVFRSFYQREEKESLLLKGYEGCQARQLAHMTHGEVFTQDIGGIGGEGPWFAIFDYRNRDALEGNAKVLWPDLSLKTEGGLL